MEGRVAAGVDPAWTPRLVLSAGSVAKRSAGRGGEALYRGPALRKVTTRATNSI